MLPTFRSREAFVPFSTAFSSFFNSTFSSRVFSSWKSYTFSGEKVTLSFSPTYGLYRICDRSIFAAIGVFASSFTFNRSLFPTISSIVRTPSFAIYSRSSCAIKRMKFSTYSGFPLKRFLSSGFWVATPTGQVSRLQTLIITHPIVTSGAVAKPNSSAPSSAAMATSRPLISLPSVSILTRFLRPFCNKVWCVSASPISHGRPALWMELSGAAPVPPSYPEIRITCAPAFATPAATVPTPASETSFTEMPAYLFAFFRS